MYKGQGVDVVDEKALSEFGMTKVKPLYQASTYTTPGGDVVVDSSIVLQSKALGKIQAMVVEDSPNLVSVGRRCMLQGYGFYWPPFKHPYLISPDRKRRIQCVVENFVPFVYESSGLVCHITEGTSSSSGIQRPANAGEPNPDLPAMVPKGEVEGEQAPGQKEPQTEDLQDELPENYQDPDDVPLLALEATSLHHLLTHLPKNPHCQACQRAKIQRKPHRKNKQSPKARAHAEELGESFHGPHCYLSPRDAGTFFAAAVEHPVSPGHHILYATSRPAEIEMVDLEPTKKLLDWEPLDRWPEGATDDLPG